jgi:hypothetical protein
MKAFKLILAGIPVGIVVWAVLWIMYEEGCFDKKTLKNFFGACLLIAVFAAFCFWFFWGIGQFLCIWQPAMKFCS